MSRLTTALPALALVAVLLLAPRSVRAEDTVTPAPLPARPVRHAGLEINPLAPIVGRFGAQAQVGLWDEWSIVAYGGALSLPDTQRTSDYDALVLGNPAVRGWQLEVGPRVHVRVGRDAFLWFSASYLHDALVQSGLRSCAPGACTTGPPTTVTREGGALDVGVHVVLGGPAYVLLGAGIGGKGTSGRSLAARDDGGYLQVRGERGDGAFPRLLLALGVGL